MSVSEVRLEKSHIPSCF